MIDTNVLLFFLLGMPLMLIIALKFSTLYRWVSILFFCALGAYLLWLTARVWSLAPWYRLPVLPFIVLSLVGIPFRFVGIKLSGWKCSERTQDLSFWTLLFSYLSIVLANVYWAVLNDRWLGANIPPEIRNFF